MFLFKIIIFLMNNYGFWHRLYPGELVSHHISGIYIAYAILTPGKNLGVVRVVNRQTDERTLIKVFLLSPVKFIQ